eukprot:2523035-Prymnesium_polylepis.1
MAGRHTALLADMKYFRRSEPCSIRLIIGYQLSRTFLDYKQSKPSHALNTGAIQFRPGIKK